jgi:hypothetical protein
MAGGHQRRGALLGVALALLWVALGASAVPASAFSNATVRVVAAVNGQDVDHVDANRPLRLSPQEGTVIRVAVTNLTSRPLTIRIVRLHGKVMGLTFYTYDTRIDLRLDPGATGQREFAVDLSDLGGQATGLVPGRLTLLDERRHVVVSKAFPVDVRGSIVSVYGVFGATVAAITALLLIAALIRLATHRLPSARWSRGTRFGVPGIGIGLVLTFSLSTFRVVNPDASKWLPLVLAGGAIGFVFGYLTPRPEQAREPEVDEVDDEEPFRFSPAALFRRRKAGAAQDR